MALNGGAGWGGAWVDADGDVPLASTNTSLSYPAGAPLTPSGGRIEVTGTEDPATRAAAERSLGTTMNLATGGQEFYSSALFRRSALTGESAFVNFFSGPNVRWFYGVDDAGNPTVAVAPDNAAQRATSTVPVAPNADYLLVARIRTNTGPGGNDEVFLKTFAPGDTIVEPADDAAWDLRSHGNSGVTLAGVRLTFANVAGQTNQFDEFRVGTTFADVTGVPEPASAALAGLAALGLLARRRRDYSGNNRGAATY